MLLTRHPREDPVLLLTGNAKLKVTRLKHDSTHECSKR